MADHMFLVQWSRDVTDDVTLPKPWQFWNLESFEPKTAEKKC